MDDVVAASLEVFFHPCAQMQDMHDLPPLDIVGAEGVWLTCRDGRRIIDGIASWWCKSFGHGHPHLLAALHRQADAFEHVIAANTTHAGLVRLCQRLLAMANGHPAARWAADAPAGKLEGALSRVFLADNGSTAVEVALKMALQAQSQWGHPQRSEFACLQGGYHGETVGTLSVGDCAMYSQPFRSKLFPSVRLHGLPERSGEADSRWLDASAEWPAIEAQLAPHAQRLAAIVYEPVLQGAGGMRIIDPDFLRRLRGWADAHGVLLIADEIASGFGRCGAMLASHLAGSDARGPLAAPDLCCLSKGLTGGVIPLSAVLLREPIYQAFWDDYHTGKSFLHSNTWTAHPLAIAVANAVLDLCAQERWLEGIQQQGRYLRAGMQELAEAFSCCGSVRGVGMMAAMELQGFSAQERKGRQLFKAALAHGALLRPLGDTSYLFPPLTISTQEIDQLHTCLRQACRDVL